MLQDLNSCVLALFTLLSPLVQLILLLRMNDHCVCIVVLTHSPLNKKGLMKIKLVR